jgi:hypothetical protein
MEVGGTPVFTIVSASVRERCWLTTHASLRTLAPCDSLEDACRQVNALVADALVNAFRVVAAWSHEAFIASELAAARRERRALLVEHVMDVLPQSSMPDAPDHLRPEVVRALAERVVDAIAPALCPR